MIKADDLFKEAAYIFDDNDKSLYKYVNENAGLTIKFEPTGNLVNIIDEKEHKPTLTYLEIEAIFKKMKEIKEDRKRSWKMNV